MTMFADPVASKDSVVDATNQYITLLMGFATAPDSGDLEEFDEAKEKKDGDSSDSDEEPEPGAGDTTEMSKKDKKKNAKAAAEAKKNAKVTKVPSLRRLVPFTWTDSLDVKHRNPV